MTSGFKKLFPWVQGMFWWLKTLNLLQDGFLWYVKHLIDHSMTLIQAKVQGYQTTPRTQKISAALITSLRSLHWRSLVGTSGQTLVFSKPVIALWRCGPWIIEGGRKSSGNVEVNLTMCLVMNFFQLLYPPVLLHLAPWDTALSQANRWSVSSFQSGREMA